MKTYKDITKCQADLQDKYIENNLLKSLDIEVIAHFGNCTTLNMIFEDCGLFSGMSMGWILSEVIKIIIETLDLSEEDGIRLSTIKNKPARIVRDSQWGKVIGFGHFMKDRFILVEDIFDLAKENVKEQILKLK